MIKIVSICIVFTLITGCGSMPNQLATEGYQERRLIESSLFNSDMEVLGEEAVKRILDSKIILPKKAKMAIMKFPGRREQSRYRYGYSLSYWESEELIKSQAQFFDALLEPLNTCDRLSEVTNLPSLMVPTNANIAVLREAAVRMQAELLLVYRAEGSVFEKYVFLGKDKVKAHATAEAVLLDVRTGVIPFTLIASETFEGRKEKEDLTNAEMIRRAEDQATILALNKVGRELADFLNTAP